MTTHSLAGRRNFLKSVAGTLCVPRMQHGIGALLPSPAFCNLKERNDLCHLKKCLLNGRCMARLGRLLQRPSANNCFRTASPQTSPTSIRVSNATGIDVIRNLEAFQQRQPGGSFALKSILPHHDVALVNP